MKLFFAICLLLCLEAYSVTAQSPPSQIYFFVGYPAIGADYAKKISHDKWSSGVLSLAVSPNFYFRRYSFNWGPNTSKFRSARMMLPVTLRFDFYPNQILQMTIGKNRAQVGLFVDAGYCVNYTLSARLTERFFDDQDPSDELFNFDGSMVYSKDRLSFHPTIGFGFRAHHVLFFMRTIVRPYPWKDLSAEWNLPDGETSYFYSWEYQQPGVMICLGYIL